LLGDGAPAGFALKITLNPSRGLFIAIPDSPIRVGALSNTAKNATVNEIRTTVIIIEVMKIVFGFFAFPIKASVYPAL